MKEDGRRTTDDGLWSGLWPFVWGLVLAVSGCGRGGVRAVPAVATAPAAAPPASTCRFVDVTQQAGIHFRAQASHTPRKYLLETMGSGCAFVDYDGDGWQDILLLNGAPLPGGHVRGRPTMRLYHNDRNGHFTDTTHEAGLDKEVYYAMGAAVGDYDNDGRDDIYVSAVLGPGHLYHNEYRGGEEEKGRRGEGERPESGTPHRLIASSPHPYFRDVTAQAGLANAGRWGTSCAWVDYDRDGRLDLFVCNYVKYGSLKEDLPCHSGARNLPVYCFPSAYATSHCELYHNLGNGRFEDVSERTGIASAHGKSLGVSVWDYDRDGWADLFVSNDTSEEFLFHNERNGTFRNVGVPSGIAYDDYGNAYSGMGIDAADPDADGKTRVVVTNYYGSETRFFRQAEDQMFTDERGPSGIGSATKPTLGFGAVFFDYDNDGFQDLLQVNGHVQDNVQEINPVATYAEQTLLFRNLGGGRYEEVGTKCGAPFTRRIVGRGAAWGDYDNDGREDVLITTNNGPAMLWRNETPSKNHWLTLKLVGSKSPRDGTGAVVLVTANGVTQRVMARSGSSYLSCSDLRPHVGLGKATAADLEIHWPSGAVDHLRALQCDRIVTIQEGASAGATDSR